MKIIHTLDASAGDLVWVEPGEAHIEVNRSADEPVRTLVIRTPADIAIDLPSAAPVTTS